MSEPVVPAEDKAYKAIRAAIIGGTHGSGAHLNAADIGESLGISRTPVREAFRRLQAEGLVTLIANRGAYVTPWTRDDLDEVFGLRLLLEGHAAAMAAQRMTTDELANLRGLADQMDRVVAARAPDHVQTIMTLNAEFHRGIISASGQRRLAIMMATIVDAPLILRTFTVYSDEDMARSMSHHQELITAFTTKDADWASSVMRSHLRAAHQVMLRSGIDSPEGEATR